MKQRKWWQEAVGYEIYPRSFCDSNNDGIGDLPGIISKLDYLEKLGVNILWICPFFKSPMDDNGYDVSDYLTVDPVFGTNQDFQELLSKAHAKGIHIVIDFVLNHTSDEHPWFLEARSSKTSEKRDFYIWRDGKVDAKGKRLPPNNWQGFFEDSAWNYDSVAGQYYLKIFSKKMPDLNWENANLRKHIFDVAKYWLDQGVDGFRLDAIAHLAKDLTFSDSLQPVGPTGMTLDFRKFSSIPRLFDYLAEFKHEVLAHYPEAMTIGEVGGCASTEEALKYSGRDKGSIDMVFNFDTCWENGAFGSEKKSDDEIVTNVINLKRLFLHWYEDCSQKAWLPIYWNNHDHPRVLSQYGDIRFRKASGKMLALTLLFMYGTPFLYNGEEIGMSNVDYTRIEDFKDVSAKNFYESAKTYLTDSEILRFLRRCSRVNARTPFQWSPEKYAGFSKHEPDVRVIGNYQEVNVADEEKDPDSILNFYRQAIALRKAPRILDAVLEGKFILVDPNHPDVFAYAHKGATPLLVVSNFRRFDTAFSFPYKIKTILLHNEKTMNLSNGVLHLKPFESYLFELDEKETF